MEKKLKIKLGIYLIFTIISFLILVTSFANLGMTLFILFQIIAVLLLLPKSKALLLLIPIFLIGLSYTLWNNFIWYPTNIIVFIILISIMALLITKEFNSNNKLFGFIKQIFFNIFRPFKNFGKPFDWKDDLVKDEKKTMKRVFYGIIISIPFIILILILLSSADMIFSHTIGNFFNKFWNIISINTFFRIIGSILTGLYLFGFVYLVLNHKKNDELKNEKKINEKDTLVLNVFLGIILAIYSLFIIIQFRYLFAGANLPFNLSYAEYARRGFFELLVLTGINIGLILISSQFKKIRNTLSGKINNGLLYYLCTVNIILLGSSFYRMYLYSNDYGLTRLRLYVFAFLAFELIALLITYFYIYKPKFNIVLVYACITLIYYVLLNIVPTDRFIAYNLINKYKNESDFDISYVMNLSLDAAPEIKKLINDDKYKADAERYFVYKANNYGLKWQEYNFSFYKARDIKENLNVKR